MDEITSAENDGKINFFESPIWVFLNSRLILAIVVAYLASPLGVPRMADNLKKREMDTKYKFDLLYELNNISTSGLLPMAWEQDEEFIFSDREFDQIILECSDSIDMVHLKLLIIHGPITADAFANEIAIPSLQFLFFGKISVHDDASRQRFMEIRFNQYQALGTRINWWIEYLNSLEAGEDPSLKLTEKRQIKTVNFESGWPELLSYETNYIDPYQNLDPLPKLDPLLPSVVDPQP